MPPGLCTLAYTLTMGEGGGSLAPLADFLAGRRGALRWCNRCIPVSTTISVSKSSGAWARKGQHSIRINGHYRICFTWADGNADNVEIVDYH